MHVIYLQFCVDSINLSRLAQRQIGGAAVKRHCSRAQGLNVKDYERNSRLFNTLEVRYRTCLVVACVAQLPGQCKTFVSILATHVAIQ